MTNKELMRLAVLARENAYAPYSGFRVGAALLARDGRVFGGCNIENAAYSPTNCAERTAIFKAVSEGVREFTAIAIVGGKGDELSPLCAPCGVCRQVLLEFCPPSMPVLLGTPDNIEETTLSALMPYAFGKGDLTE